MNVKSRIMEKGDEEFRRLSTFNVGDIYNDDEEDGECNEDDNDNDNDGDKQNNKDNKVEEKPGTLKQYRNI